MCADDTILFLHSSAGRYGADRLLLALAAGLDRDRFTPVAVLPERGELAGLLEDAGVEAVVADLAVLRRAELGPRAALEDGSRRQPGSSRRSRAAAAPRWSTRTRR